MKKEREKNIFFRKTLWILLSIFIISVLVRIPNLNRPLSKHHEFCTALSLIILQAWADGGIQSYQFNPPTTFSLRADHFINNCSMDTMQRNGNFFYFSHPPLAYYLPYAVFNTLNIYPNVIALQVFNLLFEFITIIFIYLITAVLLQRNSKREICWTAIAASTLYLFLPVTLWFQSNVYMADMFVQNTWAPALFVTLKIFLERKQKSFTWLLFFSISLFVMIYTDWVGVFFAGSIVSAAFYIAWRKHEKSFYWIGLLSLIIPLVTALIVLKQYSSIAGWPALKYCFINRYNERGILVWSGFGNFISSLEALAFNYAASYLPVLPAIAIFLWKRKSILSHFQNFNLFIWLTLAPVIIDHFIFLKYAAQDFAVLKASFFLSIISAISISDFAENKKGWWRNAMVAFICLIGITLYYYINRPGEFSMKGDYYAFEKETGVFIQQNAEPKEVVFAKNFDVTPQIIFYAHRNIKRIRSDDDAINFLKKHSQSQGIIFNMRDGKLQVSKIQK